MAKFVALCESVCTDPTCPIGGEIHSKTVRLNAHSAKEAVEILKREGESVIDVWDAEELRERDCNDIGQANS